MAAKYDGCGEKESKSPWCRRQRRQPRTSTIPVALDKVMEELQADVERLAGARYARERRLPGHTCAGPVGAARCIWPTRRYRSGCRGSAISIATWTFAEDEM